MNCPEYTGCDEFPQCGHAPTPPYKAGETVFTPYYGTGTVNSTDEHGAYVTVDHGTDYYLWRDLSSVPESPTPLTFTLTVELHGDTTPSGIGAALVSLGSSLPFVVGGDTFYAGMTGGVRAPGEGATGKWSVS